MYINLLVQCGRQSPDERWAIVKEFEDRGSGIGILAREMGGGKQVLVEFRVEGIIWRRALFALVVSEAAGARTIFDKIQYEVAIQTVERFYHAETVGREPMMLLMTLAGTRYVTQAQGIAIVAFEKEQQTLINSNKSPDFPIVDFSLEYDPEGDDPESSIGTLGWLDDDIDLSAFNDWSNDDEEPGDTGPRQ